MKKGICIFLTVLLLFTAAGCSAPSADSDKLQVICTVFPQYDWMRNIIGEGQEQVELTLLMDNGADLHNYQANVDDLLAISACDLFIYVGGASDEWVEDALQNPTNPNRKTVALLDLVEPLETEHDHGEDEDHDDEEEHEYDEHVWLSLKNAEEIVEQLTDLMVAIDPDHASTYTANSSAYRAKVGLLERQYQDCVDNGVRKTLLFADRFPFRYPAQDYGLSWYAAFSGCSAETEASFATLTRLTETVNREDLPVVLVTETSDQSIARTVIGNTETKDQEIVAMDSMQAVTRARIDAGDTYLGIMEENLKALHKALY